MEFLEDRHFDLLFSFLYLQKSPKNKKNRKKKIPQKKAQKKSKKNPKPRIRKKNVQNP